MMGLARAAGANATNCIWNCTHTMMASTIQREAESLSVVVWMTAVSMAKNLN
jgi:hypothetical protein